MSAKCRKNLFVEACGLEAIYAPRVVLENLRRDSNGDMISIATAGDGRILWSGKTKSIRNFAENATKFSSPYNSLDGVSIRKLKRFSYLAGRLSSKGFCEEAVKPLVRLCLQFWKLKFKDFNGLCRKIFSLAKCQQFKVDSYPRAVHLRIKPFRTGKWKTLGVGQGMAPLWCWKTVYRPPE